MKHTLPRLLRLACVAGFASFGIGSTQTESSADTSLLRLDQLLWREVRNVQGQELGGVSDLLVQMPSGRLVFVAVDPSELFQRPKAVPPAALRISRGQNEALVLDIAKQQWIDAPRLDWDAALVIKNTDEGGKIYGYYQQPWPAPDPTPGWGMIVKAPAAEARSVARYVSLKSLLFDRVETNGRQHAGYIRGFLIDWSAKRATHALVAPRFTPLVRQDATWFAIPVSLLTPAVEDDGIVVNSSVEAFRNAPNWPSPGKRAPGDPTTIYRYPAQPIAHDNIATRGSR